LLRGHPDLDETLPFDRYALQHGVLPALQSCFEFARRLRRERFDLVLDMQGLLRTGLMTLASGAACRVGFAGAREGARWFYTHAIPEPNGLHTIERYLLAATALGGKVDEISYRLSIDQAALEWAYARLKPWPRPWLAVGVGARWRTKRWPPRHFAALLQRAQAEFGGTALFVGGNDETALSQEAIRLLSAGARNLTADTSLPQLAALLSLADVMIANDTGPLHLAVALGRPVVAPYTCTQVRFHGPHGQMQHGVETSVACRGSYLRNCSRLDCMTELTPDRLWPILDGVLTTWQNSSRCA
jgi:ADP-heptose:LPS heptosyltransferase